MPTDIYAKSQYVAYPVCSLSSPINLKRWTLQSERLFNSHQLNQSWYNFILLLTDLHLVNSIIKNSNMIMWKFEFDIALGGNINKMIIFN
jgi:hypothetical protein